MKVRFKGRPDEYDCNKLNTYGVSEVYIYDDEGIDTVFIKDLEVLLKTGWKDMQQAFKDNDLVTDNYNTCFREPFNDEERKKGYYE